MNQCILGSINGFRTKFFRGIKLGSRIAYLGFVDEQPCATAVVKIGENTKFCHLHIDEKYTGNSVGDLFFSMMTINVRNFANSIHFTLPEGLWESKSDFFKSFGFKDANIANTQYRLGESELSCLASFETVWKHTLIKIPKIIELHSLSTENPFSGILMSVKPQFIEKMFSGDKVVEVRKRFHSKWKNRRVTFYSSSPSKALHGYAKIQSITKDSPANIWDKFGDDLGCSKKEFEDYSEGHKELCAISITDTTPYKNPIYLSQLSKFVNHELVPPQSYSSLCKNAKWVDAVSVAELLHGKFRTVIG